MNIYLYVDERLVGFFVFGIVKVKKCLVVLLCMLGIVVVNYYLVVCEVFYLRVLFIVLIVDRLYELRDVGVL